MKRDYQTVHSKTCHNWFTVFNVL